MSYNPPSIEIQQEFAAIPTAVTQPLQPCIVGPNYRVFQYSNSADHSTISLGAYNDGSDEAYNWPGLPSGGVVDQSSAQLVFEQLWAEYASAVATTLGSAQNIIDLTSNSFVASQGFVRNSAFHNRDVQIGDQVLVTGGISPLKASIVGFRSAQIASSAGSFTNGAGNNSTAGASAIVTAVSGHIVGTHTGTSSAAAYLGNLAAGYISDTYTITATSAAALGTATFSVTSLNGDNVTLVTSGTTGVAFNVGTLGLTFTITGTGNTVLGEQWTVVATAPYTQVEPAITGGSAADYAGAVNTTYTIKVVRGGTWGTNTIQISASTNNGVDYMPVTTITENNSFALGSLGVTARFPTAAFTTQSGLIAGETYLVTLTAASQGAINQAVLSTPVDTSVSEGGSLTVNFYIYKASMTIPNAGYPHGDSVALTTSTTQATVKAGIVINDSTWVDNSGNPLDLPVTAANIFVPYRALLTFGAQVFSTISSLSSVSAVLGATIPKNPLAYGVYKALENSNGQPINYVAITSDDLTGYTNALATLEQNSNAYFIVPLTCERDIVDLYQAHVDAMSSPTSGLERVTLISQPLTTTEVLYGNNAPMGGYWTGYVAISGGQYVALTIPGANFLVSGVRPGDSVRVEFGVDNFGNPTYTTATVASVTDAQDLVLEAPGLGTSYGSTGSPLRIDIIRNLTVDEQAAAIAATSSSFADRRVYSVWPDLPTDDAGNEVAAYFLACALAGLKSSVAPQQGITTYTLIGWSSMARSFQYFTPTQLNTIAGGGTMIVTQDVVGGPVYVRHQVSTDMSDVNHSELSVTTNLDSISKFCRSGLQGYKGKYNSTPTFLALARTQLLQMLSYLQNNTITETAGPQVVDYDTASVTVVQDPILVTQVDAAADIVLPYPVNNFKLALTVVQSVPTATAA